MKNPLTLTLFPQGRGEGTKPGNSLTYSLSMFVSLTIGYAVVHAVLASFGISVKHAIWPISRSWEKLEITEKGEAVIESGMTNPYRTIASRRLDGTPISDTHGMPQKFARPIYLHFPYETAVPLPTIWEHRIISFSDFQTPATNWYLIAPPNQPGTAFFIGYDQLSRRQIGYLDVNGLNVQTPAADQSFSIGSGPYYTLDGCIASTQEQGFYRYAFEPATNGVLGKLNPSNATADAVWVLSQGTVYEIRLRNRTIRKLLENRPDLRSLTSSTIERDGKSYLQLIVLTDHELLLIDPESMNTDVVKLEPGLESGGVSFYQLPDGEQILVQDLLLDQQTHSQRSVIKWLDARGQVVRREEADLQGWVEESTWDFFAGISLGLPSPVVSFVAWAVSPYFQPSRWTASQTYFERLYASFHDLKGWLAITFVIGVASGWACRRRERDVFGSSSWFWPILVGTCGWFGWMGYICVKPLPARLPHGRWLPAQPEPNQPLGTEIFA